MAPTSARLSLTSFSSIISPSSSAALSVANPATPSLSTQSTALPTSTTAPTTATSTITTTTTANSSIYGRHGRSSSISTGSSLSSLPPSPPYNRTSFHNPISIASCLLDDRHIIIENGPFSCSPPCSPPLPQLTISQTALNKKDLDLDSTLQVPHTSTRSSFSSLLNFTSSSSSILSSSSSSSSSTTTITNNNSNTASTAANNKRKGLGMSPLPSPPQSPTRFPPVPRLSLDTSAERLLQPLTSNNNSTSTLVGHGSGDQEYIKLFSPLLVASPVSYLDINQMMDDEKLWEHGPDHAFQTQLDNGRREQRQARVRQQIRGAILGLVLGCMIGMLILQQTATHISVFGSTFGANPEGVQRDAFAPIYSPWTMTGGLVCAVAIARSPTHAMIVSVATCAAALTCFATLLVK